MQNWRVDCTINMVLVNVVCSNYVILMGRFFAMEAYILDYLRAVLIIYFSNNFLQPTSRIISQNPSLDALKYDEYSQTKTSIFMI